jgi:hypothetical protein
MQTKHPPRLVSALRWLALGSLLAALAGCASPVGQALRNRQPLPGAPEIGGYAMLEIDSTPEGAIITVNGRMIGQAPASYRYELDAVGDVAIDLDITANFADAPGLPRNQSPPIVSHRVSRGDRAPTIVTFDTEAAVSR